MLFSLLEKSHMNVVHMYVHVYNSKIPYSIGLSVVISKGKGPAISQMSLLTTSTVN